MRFLNTILLVLILIVAAGGAAYYYFNSNGQINFPMQQPQQEQMAEQPLLAAPIFLALEPFTVTIQGNRGTQILYTEITLRLNDTRSHTGLVQYMPEVRNRVLAELALYSAAELQTSEGRNDLALRLRNVLSEPFHPHVNGASVSSVLFTAFVIQ